MQQHSAALIFFISISVIFIKSAFADRHHDPFHEIHKFQENFHQIDPNHVYLAGKKLGKPLEKFRSAILRNPIDALRQFRAATAGVAPPHCLQMFIESLENVLEAGACVALLSNNSNLIHLAGSVLLNCGRRPTQEWKTIMAKNLWILQPIDASGKFPAGIMDIRLPWEGNYQQCKRLHIDYNGQKFNGRYCSVQIPLQPIISAIVPQPQNNPSAPVDYCANSNQISSNTLLAFILYRLCLPQDCNENEVAEYFRQLFNTTLVCSIVCVADPGPWSKAQISCLAFLCFLGTLMLLGTIYDMLIYQRLLNYATKEKNISADALFKHQNVFIRLILAFSVYSNAPKILDLSKKGDQIDCLHGLRFFSMTWVITGHIYTLAVATDNVLQAFKIPGKFINLAITNATPSVDTFFLLSGFLVTYLWLKDMAKCQGKKLTSWKYWLLYYLHRYIRLTPLLALIIWIDVGLLKRLYHGAYYVPQIDKNCQDNWWAALLYVNNIVRSKAQCWGVTWYLSNDMQFYVFAPLVLVPMFLSPWIGSGLAMLFVVTHMLASGLYTHEKNFPPTNTFTVNPLKDANTDMGNTIYIKPWFRWGTYAVGMLLGLLLHLIHTKKLKIKLNAPLALAGWALAIAMGSAVIFGIYDYSKGEGMELNMRAFYAAGNRIAWVLAVAWVIFACDQGYGGPINGFLSWRVWLPFSRLTYCAYLFHPMLEGIYIGSLDKIRHWHSDFEQTSLCISFVIMSYLIAIPLSLAIEVPMLTIEKILFGGFGRGDQGRQTAQTPTVYINNAPQPAPATQNQMAEISVETESVVLVSIKKLS